MDLEELFKDLNEVWLSQRPSSDDLDEMLAWYEKQIGDINGEVNEQGQFAGTDSQGFAIRHVFKR